MECRSGPPKMTNQVHTAKLAPTSLESLSLQPGVAASRGPLHGNDAMLLPEIHK